jgi:hypothetical protein
VDEVSPVDNGGNCVAILSEEENRCRNKDRWRKVMEEKS